MIETNTNRKRETASPRFQPIVIEQIYNRREAAAVMGCAVITLIRAFDSGHLKGFRIGRHVRHSGEQLKTWLESGGKTGWSMQKPEER